MANAENEFISLLSNSQRLTPSKPSFLAALILSLVSFGIEALSLFTGASTFRKETSFACMEGIIRRRDRQRDRKTERESRRWELLEGDTETQRQKDAEELARRGRFFSFFIRSVFQCEDGVCPPQ